MKGERHNRASKTSRAGTAYVSTKEGSRERTPEKAARARRDRECTESAPEREGHNKYYYTVEAQGSPERV